MLSNQSTKGKITIQYSSFITHFIITQIRILHDHVMNPNFFNHDGIFEGLMPR